MSNAQRPIVVLVYGCKNSLMRACTEYEHTAYRPTATAVSAAVVWSVERRICWCTAIRITVTSRGLLAISITVHLTN